MKKDQWYLWGCKCGSSMKINYVASEKEYNRFKKCYCGDTLEFKKDL